MILRRVIEHVREQNWTAIGIDFCIVVIGVFVGIEVSNWNAEREARQRGAAFAERLRADLGKDREVHDVMARYYSDVRDAADLAVAALEGRAPLSDHDLLVNAYRATQYIEGARRRSTYDELVSTGSLALIADPALREIATRVYRVRTLDNLVRESLESPYRREFRKSVAYEVQRELARTCGDRRIPDDKGALSVVELGHACTLELPAAAIGAAAGMLRANQDLIGELRRRLADLEIRLVDLDRVRQGAFEP